MRPLCDTPFLHGLHEPGGEGDMAAAGRPGWLLFTEEMGADPGNHGGHDYRPWSDQGFGILSRLNHGYGSAGTLPHSSRYDDFARRCANFVAASPGCHLWIIGNETNLAAERPRLPGRSATPDGADDLFPPETPRPPDPADPRGHGSPSRFNLLHPDQLPTRGDGDGEGEIITPALYADCFRRCRSAIRALPGHAEDHVIIGGVAPWNNQTRYPGNENGDWVRYFSDILALLGPAGCDGIALHTYTHGTDPALVTDGKRMDPPFQARHYHFQAYRDFMTAIPANLRHLGVYITEADQDEPWLDQNNGWVQRAYEEIDGWNRTAGNQQIRALILYRYPQLDKWHIEGKGEVQAAFRDVVGRGYRWNESAVVAAAPVANAWRAGSTLRTAAAVRLRRSPGSSAKPADDVLASLPVGATFTLLAGGPQSADGLNWWPLRATAGGGAQTGWMADAAPDGTVLLSLAAEAPPFAPNEQVFNAGTGQLNLRATAGLGGAVVARLPVGASATVLAGPQSADGLTWWRARYTDTAGAAHEGWLADRAPDKTVLLVSGVFR